MCKKIKNYKIKMHIIKINVKNKNEIKKKGGN